MTFGHNFDFESYCIVGKIVKASGNVYAETTRYNYGPIFFGIQGLLYTIASLTKNVRLAYRILMVLMLTLVDLGITCIIAKKYSWKKSLIFFLNPVSIIITGYHNQFDNIAILLMLIAGMFFYNEDKKWSYKEFFFVLFMSLSLITKHIFFILPLYILLKKDLPISKKLLYSVVPPFLFLLSFVPFAIGNKMALEGIIHNVFLYRSFNNAPLLIDIYEMLKLPSKFYIVVFIIFMTIFAWICRRRRFDEIILLYTMVLVTFSSSIANQYLAIPMVALSVFDIGIFRYIYMIVTGALLVYSGDGLNYMNHYQIKEFFFSSKMYSPSVFILFIILVYKILKNDILSSNQKVEEIGDNK